MGAPDVRVLGGASYREAQSRQVIDPNPAVPVTWTWNIALDNNPNLHAEADVVDLGANTRKVWTFGTSGAYAGLASSYEERDGTGTALVHKDYLWAQDDNGKPYVNVAATTLDPGKSYPAQTATAQTLDVYGNPKTSAVYPYTSSPLPVTSYTGGAGGPAPARTYDYSYLHEPLANASYKSLYILNRLTLATVTAAGETEKTTTLAANTYDGGTLRAQDAFQHDGTNYGVLFPYRGNVTSRTTPAGYATVSYYATGSVASATNEAGVQVDSTPDASTSTTQYDNYGRPSASSKVDGAQTTYTYTYNPPTQKATLTRPAREHIYRDGARR